jgi:hypothetical protein
MEAEEMFKELGYMCFTHGTSILYVNDSSDDEEIRSIRFDCKECTFDAVTNNNEPLRIDLALFDAIQTQMRELRWI